MSLEDAIHCLCDTYREPLEPACERRGPVRFHQQVQMIRLYGKLQDAEAFN
jgi:hypothetical protein